MVKINDICSMIKLIGIKIEFMEAASHCVFSEFGIGVWYDTRMPYAESPVYHASLTIICGIAGSAVNSGWHVSADRHHSFVT